MARDDGGIFHSAHTDAGISIRDKLAMDYALKHSTHGRLNRVDWVEEAMHVIKAAYEFADLFIAEMRRSADVGQPRQENLQNHSLVGT